jgi:putative hydrolase of the HAD superfamily
MDLKENLKYALFDLDNTLYPHSCGLWDEIGNRINLYMIERLQMDPQEVGRRRDEFLKAFGTTLNALRRYYSVDPDEFLDFVHDIPLEQFLQQDRELDRMLQRLRWRKTIFTNADAKHARRVLSRLGVKHHFESIIDIHLLEFVNKPDRRSYLRALEFASARPEECVLIEDSLVNITAARALGITTVMVGGGPESNGADYHIERITDLEDIAEFGLRIAD